MQSTKHLTSSYKNWINELKKKFQSSQIKASIQVNSTLLEFYWNLGTDIVEKEKEYSWGSRFLEQLSHDLSIEFPNIKGFSYRNLRAIKQWFLFWQQLVAKMENSIYQQTITRLFLIPWGHNIAIVSKCKTTQEALFYVENTIKYGISRSVLINQIESNLYSRSGKAITNFENTLPPMQSDLAKEIIKDPYNFDFLTLSEDFKEKELENALCENITKFLLELGNGFSFVGKQYKLNIGGDEYKSALPSIEEMEEIL